MMIREARREKGERMPRVIGVALVLGVLVAPTDAFALRYASPVGSSANDCSAPDPAHACTLEKAIHGSGGNVPSNGEEIVILTGSYPPQTTPISNGASNLNIHGEGGQPRQIGNQS